MVEPLWKQGTWYPFNAPITCTFNSLPYGSIVDDIYHYGLEHTVPTRKECYVYIIHWLYTVTQSQDFAKQTIAFMSEDDLSLYRKARCEQKTDIEIIIIASFWSQDVIKDIDILEKIFEPVPIYKNVFYIQKWYEISFLFEITSSSHMKRIRLMQSNDEVKKLQTKIYDLQIAKDKADTVQVLHDDKRKKVEQELKKMVSSNEALALENKELRKQIRELTQIDRSGYVYLLKVLNEDNLYKIGRTKNPDNRLKTFSVKLPFPVEYDHLIKTEDMYELESRLHEQYRESRQRGSEFFLLTSDQLTAIKAIDSEGDGDDG